MNSNGINRAKVWLEVMGGALAVSVPLVVALIAVLAAMGPFPTKAELRGELAARDSAIVHLQGAALTQSRDLNEAFRYIRYNACVATPGLDPETCRRAHGIDIDELLSGEP